VGGIVVATILVGGSSQPQATPAASGHLATVQRTDLVSVNTFSGEVGSDAGPGIINRLNGTLTSQPTEGTKIARGGTLYSIDGEPIVLFYGALPAWRPINEKTTDGADVEQLEANLDALGFDPGTVDEHFTATTKSAIESWQDSAGLPVDGAVPLGRVVFAPGALKVDKLSNEVGAPARDGTTMMTTLSDTKVVVVTLDSGSDTTLETGDAVSIVRPDGSRVAGTVTAIATSGSGEDQGNGGGTSTVATVTPKQASGISSLRDGTSVDVEAADETRKDVLAVPVTALVARAAGGYAVEVVRADGRTEYVTVEPGLYADDLVEITGNVREGDKVVTP
jgi:peptidoglycan hydrolase-like protein with peptidoglycan-binding domain